MIDAPEQHDLDENPKGSDCERSGHDAAPEAEGAGEIVGQGEGDIGTEHIERAMRKIHDARDAEDDGQARGHQEQRGCTGKTGQELDDIKGHGRSGSAWFDLPLPARGERSARKAIRVSGTLQALRWRREPLTPALSP